MKRLAALALLTALIAPARAADLSPIFEVGEPSRQSFSTWAYGYGALTPDREHVAAYVALDASRGLRTGAHAQVRLDTAQGEGQVVEGTITDLLADANPRTRQAIATIKIPRQDLPARTYAHVQVELNSRVALAVPTDAVIWIDAKSTIFRQKGEDDFEPVVVDVGEQTPVFSEVRSGLKSGDKILVKGALEWSAKDTMVEEK